MKVGVLALQGAFREHQKALTKLGCEAPLVYYPDQIEGLDGLVLPGGESTAINLLLEKNGFTGKILNGYKRGMGIFGTCAGAILLAKNVIGGEALFGLMDITVERNAYGRQVDSFETDVQITGATDPFNAIFIRAPKITSVNGKAELLASVENHGVLAVQDRLLAATFHPELTNDLRIHKMFLDLL